MQHNLTHKVAQWHATKSTTKNEKNAYCHSQGMQANHNSAHLQAPKRREIMKATQVGIHHTYMQLTVKATGTHQYILHYTMLLTCIYQNVDMHLTALLTCMHQKHREIMKAIQVDAHHTCMPITMLLTDMDAICIHAYHCVNYRHVQTVRLR